MEKVLYACDELSGFITASTLVKPSKSLAEVDAKSVRKKMKDKAFARSVNRDDIINGAADLGVDLEEHIAFCIEAMKAIAGDLGLAGTAASYGSPVDLLVAQRHHGIHPGGRARWYEAGKQSHARQQCGHRSRMTGSATDTPNSMLLTRYAAITAAMDPTTIPGTINRNPCA